MRRTDTPGSEWYEPEDLVDDDDDEPEPTAPEPLVIIGRVVHWTLTD